MTFREHYNCPHCQSSNAMVYDIRPLFDDSRVDSVHCQECGARWRVYYKVADAALELEYIPQPEEGTTETLPSEGITEEASYEEMESPAPKGE